jgi:dTMP kinase
LDLHKLAQLEQWVHGHLQPDLTLLFDLAPKIARQRIAAQTRELDRFEQERADFHQRVRLAYLERAAAAPQRVVIINAEQPIQTIKQLLEEKINIYCP